MHWEFVIAGYGVALGALGIYTITLLRRGRRLSSRVPAERRRFLD